MPAAEIAVLYRVNAQSEGYEQALADAGIPYQVRGGERFFQRTEVRTAIAALRTLAGRVEGGPEGVVGADVVTAVRAVLGEQGLTETPPPGGAAGGAQRQRWESLRALVRAGVRPRRAPPGDHPRRPPSPS